MWRLASDHRRAPRSDAEFEGISMEGFQGEKSDPIRLQSTPHRVGTIMLRFVGLMFLAVAALALVYMR